MELAAYLPFVAYIDLGDRVQKIFPHTTRKTRAPGHRESEGFFFSDAE